MELATRGESKRAKGSNTGRKGKRKQRRWRRRDWHVRALFHFRCLTSSPFPPRARAHMHHTYSQSTEIPAGPTPPLGDPSTRATPVSVQQPVLRATNTAADMWCAHDHGYALVLSLALASARMLLACPGLGSTAGVVCRAADAQLHRGGVPCGFDVRWRVPQCAVWLVAQGCYSRQRIPNPLGGSDRLRRAHGQPTHSGAHSRPGVCFA